MKELIFTSEGGIATLTLNRPEQLNAITTEMIDGMWDLIQEVGNNDNIKVLIITGTGPAFCAGADVKGRLQARLAGERVDKRRRDIVKPLAYNISSLIWNLHKPIIGAINGIAVGGGLSIALLCDIRIASDKARFGAVWVKRGLVPDAGATYLLPRTVGKEKALELAFSGDIIDAKEAERIGLVGRVVPHDKLMEVAKGLAAKIASGPSVAIEFIKQSMIQAASNDLDTQLFFESYAQKVCFETDDFREGVDAYLAKRPPRFHGT